MLLSDQIMITEQKHIVFVKNLILKFNMLSINSMLLKAFVLLDLHFKCISSLSIYI